MLLAVGFSCFRAPEIASVPLERDEGAFAYPAQLLLEEIFPYKMAYSILKMPGLMLACTSQLFPFSDEPSKAFILVCYSSTIATLILLF